MPVSPKSDPQRQARELCDRALAAQMRGDARQAITLFTEAITLHPTAEAHTFRGWAHSFLGDYERAIQECLRAIELNPDFGNPYNDIGAYLIEQGRFDAAIPWLEKASGMSNYDHPCFCWFNLGRAYERKGDIERAQQHYSAALKNDPSYAPAQRGLRRLRARWN